MLGPSLRMWKKLEYPPPGGGAVVDCRFKMGMAVAVERAFNEKDAAIIKRMQIDYYIAKQELVISKL